MGWKDSLYLFARINDENMEIDNGYLVVCINGALVEITLKTM